MPRHTFKAFLLLLCVALALSACGGGGGAPPLPTTPDPDPDPDPGGDLRTKELLETCVPDVLGELLDMATAVQATLAGTGSAAGLSIPPGGLDEAEATGRLAWELDLDGGQPEVLGAFLLTDGSSGESAFTAGDVTALETGGIDALGAIVAALADGVRLDVDWHFGPPALANGQFQGEFLGGLLVGTTGQARHDDVLDGSCNSTIDWIDTPLAQLQSPYPTATFGLVIFANPDNLIGSMVAQETSTASVVTSLNGDPDANWSFDLDASLATAAP